MSNPISPDDVLVYGQISLDNVIRLPALPGPQAAVAVNADYYIVGGAALMTALPLAEWGHPVRVVGNAVGEDAYADFIRSELERYSTLSGAGIATDPRVRTPFTRRLIAPDGQTLNLVYWQERAPLPALTEDDLAGVRLLSLNGPGEAAQVAVATLAVEQGIPIITSDIADPEDPLVPLSTWIVVSQKWLQRTQSVGEGSERDFLQRVHAQNPAVTLVMTRGPETTLVLPPEGDLEEIPSYPLPPLERSGAGDVFKAGIIHGLMAEMPRYEMIRFASAAAARWVAQPAALKRAPSLLEIRALQDERGRLAPSTLPTEQTVCPICQRPTARALFEKHWRLDRRIVEAVRHRYPAWRRVDGLCPRCVRRMVGEVGLTQITVSIPDEFAQHPIYGQMEPRALPSPIRLRANPHYAGRGVRMAFLDSGFFPHADLTQPRNRILDFVDASTGEIVVGADFSVPSVSSWHGMMTSVAAAGNGHLSQGYYAGLASEAEVLLVKVMSPHHRLHEADILRGLRWLSEHWRAYGIQILNISLGGDEGLRPDSELNQLVNQLVAEGMVIVVAAGNAGEADLNPPASAAGAITVGGVDDQNTLDPETNQMWHSNWGHIGGGMLKPELLAPSIWVAAPVLPGTPTAETLMILDRLYRAPDPHLPEMLRAVQHELNLAPADLNQLPEQLRLLVLEQLLKHKYISPFYQHVDGTSFAAPIVASVVAQMLEANPALSPERVKELLIATAQPLPNVPEERQGYGVVTPGKAVAAALHERFGPYQPGELSPQREDGRVRFMFREPNAQTVSVVGDWNDWQLGVLPMEARGNGLWVAEIDAPEGGAYQYKFVIDDERWLDDPENLEKVVDGYGGFNGVLVVE